MFSALIRGKMLLLLMQNVVEKHLHDKSKPFLISTVTSQIWRTHSVSFLNISKTSLFTNRFFNLWFNLKLDVVRINSRTCLTENQAYSHAGLFSLGCISHGFFLAVQWRVEWQSGCCPLVIFPFSILLLGTLGWLSAPNEFCLLPASLSFFFFCSPLCPRLLSPLQPPLTLVAF